MRRVKKRWRFKRLPIIVQNNSDMQQEIRCRRVKALLVGLETTETHKCASLNFFLIDWMKRCLNEMRSSSLATGSSRSTCPSPLSTANQLLHMKFDLDSIQSSNMSFYSSNLTSLKWQILLISSFSAILSLLN